MADMKRCVAQLSLSGPWGSEHLQPGMDIDLDRELVCAQPGSPAKGQKGTDGYVDARAAVPVFTVREAIAGREYCFVDIGPIATPESTLVDGSSGPITLITRDVKE